MCSSCPHSGLNFPICVTRRLDLMSEKVPSLTKQGSFSRNTSPFRLGGTQGPQQPLLHGGGSPPQSSFPQNSKGSQQLSPWYIFGFSLLLQEEFQLPLLKSAVSGLNGPPFGLLPIIFSTLHSLKLVQGVCLTLAKHPRKVPLASELIMLRAQHAVLSRFDGLAWDLGTFWHQGQVWFLW